MDGIREIEKFRIKWKDLLASKNHGDLPEDIESLLYTFEERTKPSELGEIREIYERLKLADEQDGHLERKDCWSLVERVKKLEKEVNLWKESNDNWVMKFRNEFSKREQIESRIKELEKEKDEIIERAIQIYVLQCPIHSKNHVSYWEWVLKGGSHCPFCQEERIKVLTEAIEKHKEEHYEHGWWQHIDEELYKVLDGK